MIETSILIPTKNGGAEFDSCLRAVFGQRDVGPLEVIVVDSGSTDETLEIAQRYPVRVQQISPEAFHHARTRNYAAGLSRGEFLVFLSQDAIPVSDTWLSAMISNFEDRSVGAAYGRHLPKPGSTLERQDVLDAVYGEARVVKDLSRCKELGYRCYHFSDVNAAIRRSVWQYTRFPDELKVFEDLGIAKRILHSGWKIVYEPRASVYHSHNHTALELFKRYFDGGITLKRLDIWNRQTRSSMLGDVAGLLRRKLHRFEGNGTTKRTSESVGQDLAKAAGLFLGLHERYLPLALKRRLSAFRLFD